MCARQFIQWENEYKCFGQCWVFVVQNASLLSVVSCTENGAWRRSHLELRPFLFTSFASFPALNRGRIFLLRFPLCNFLHIWQKSLPIASSRLNQSNFSQIHIHIYMTGSSFVLKSWKMSSNKFHPGSKLLLLLLNCTSQAILRFHEPTWLSSSLIQLNFRAKTPS